MWYPANVIKSSSISINQKKYVNFQASRREHLRNLKTWRKSYSDIYLSIYSIYCMFKKLNPSAEAVSLIPRVFDGLFQPGLTMISEPKVGGYTRLEVFCMVHI
jgi:hypothetical protein